MTDQDNRVTTYGYDSERNLVTRVKNEYDADVVSQYDYQHNSRGQIVSAGLGGRAFAEALNARLSGAQWFADGQDTDPSSAREAPTGTSTAIAPVVETNRGSWMFGPHVARASPSPRVPARR